MAGFRGAGKLRFSVKKDDGSYSGYLDFDNLAEVSFGITGGSTTTLKSTKDDNYGAVIGSTTTPGDDQITIKFNEPNRKNLAIAFVGTDTDLTITGAAVNAESSVAGDLDAWVPLAKYKLTTAAVTVAHATTTGMTYTVDDDYELDRTNGMWRPLTGGDITAGQTVKISYTHANKSGYAIAARAASAIVGKMLFLGTNLETLERIRIEADDVELTPDGQAPFISTDNKFLEFGLKGIARVPTGQTSPYTISVYS